MKEKCYADKPQTIEHLRANARDAIVAMRAYTLEKEDEKWFQRMMYCTIDANDPLMQ